MILPKSKNLRKPISGYKACLWCGEEFPFRDSLKARADGRTGVRHSTAKYCTRPCSDKATSERNRHQVRTPKMKAALIRIHELSKGRKLTAEQRRKRSERFRGSNSHFWKGGISPLNKVIRSSHAYTEWREAVFKRDDYTCQNCKERGGRLNADHIKPFALNPELRLDINNGRTLCEPCHKNTPTYAGRANRRLVNN